VIKNKEKNMLQSKSMMRSISTAIAIVFLLVSLLASTESVSAASKLKVSVSQKTIYVGQTTKLKASKNVKWSVSKKKIAKLTKVKKRTATVKGLKPGTVYVKAKAGKKVKKTKIIVKTKPQIHLTTSKQSIGLGEYCTVFAENEKSLDISSNVIFSTKDESILSVYSSGLVMGVSPGEATVTAVLKSDKSIKASIKIRVLPTKAGTISLKVDLSDEERYPAGKTAKVWLPVPQTDEHQSISLVRFDAPEARTAELKRDSAGGRQLYIEWDENTMPEDRKATLSYHIYRRAVVNDGTIASKEKSIVDEKAFKEEFANELKETYWSGSLTSGIVKETADKIVEDAGAKTVYAKAFAIYDYMCNNYIRTDDKTVIFGDVVSILEGKRNAGSCMDMNSVFVALCRAEGIPARNLFGLRFTTGGPNCRAEFYVPGYGWVPADPAMSVKWGRGLDAPPKNDDDVTWKQIKEKYWCNAEEDWICLNMGRDIELDPKPSVDTNGEYLEVLNPDGTFNLFMFPYGEYGDQYIPCQDRANFKYEYSYDEENPIDCGC
jgi:hypothetical protein